MSRKKPETSPARSGSARPARPAPARSAPRPAERQPERPAPAASPAGLAPGDVLDLIASDPSQIDEGLAVFEDSDGRSGLDYETDVGRIDLLARDRSGALVVFMVVESDVKSLIGELLCARCTGYWSRVDGWFSMSGVPLSTNPVPSQWPRRFSVM